MDIHIEDSQKLSFKIIRVPFLAKIYLLNFQLVVSNLTIIVFRFIFDNDEEKNSLSNLGNIPVNVFFLTRKDFHLHPFLKNNKVFEEDIKGKIPVPDIYFILFVYDVNIRAYMIIDNRIFPYKGIPNKD